MPGSTVDRQLSQSIVVESRSTSRNKIVVGLYGVPGSGKTFLLHCLEKQLGREYFAFYEGSKMIANIVPGGLDAFQKLDEPEKTKWRQRAIEIIGSESLTSGKVAIFAGHFMFWAEDEDTCQVVYTKNDLDTFTHILYLDVPAEIIAQRRIDDTERIRPSTSINHLRKWQQAEKTQMRRLCYLHGILFSLVSSHSILTETVSRLVRDFRHHTEEGNLSLAESRLDEALEGCHGQLKTVLVMDADRTLTAEDTGALFWNRFSSSPRSMNEEHPLKAIFSSPLGYSYAAFRQASMLYEEIQDQDFDVLCQEVASTVNIHPEFVSLLNLVAQKQHVGAVIISCGLHRVWKKVLERAGLAKTVKIIAGGRIEDEIVVTGAVKAALVSRLRSVHQVYVWAFGDSPLDLEMLKKADRAIVVVGDKDKRSKTMDEALVNAIDNEGLRAHQIVLPRTSSPRWNTDKLPLIDLTNQEFVDSVLCRRSRSNGIQMLHATDTNSAKLLMTPMRDVKIAGPVLREAHRRVGWYLATEFVVEVIGLEEYSIAHVQGHNTSGYRLSYERHTSIVALMRGGEAMALGVNEAFPLAMFVHASRPEDVNLHHLQGQRNILLVDSVVNSGNTVVQFVQHVRHLNATIRIVVIAAVIQADAVSEGSLAQALAHDKNLSLVSLRVSKNKFTGTGITDTGNRLYNTTHLP